MQKATALKAKAAEDLRKASIPDGLLNGTGTEQWRELWEAARQFSTETAYQERGFPVTEDEARCVLCQQDLDQSAAAKQDVPEPIEVKVDIENLDEWVNRIRTRRQGAV